jgi:hypothetical protein
MMEDANSELNLTIMIISQFIQGRVEIKLTCGPAPRPMQSWLNQFRLLHKST